MLGVEARLHAVNHVTVSRSAPGQLDSSSNAATSAGCNSSWKPFETTNNRQMGFIISLIKIVVIPYSES